MFIGTSVNQPIGTILCWFVSLNWIGDHTILGFPIISQVYLGNMFTSYPKSKITLSTSYSPICALNLNSPLVLFFHCTWFTIICAMGVSISYVQWSIISYSVFNANSSFISSMQLLKNSFSMLPFTFDFYGTTWSMTWGTDDDAPQSYLSISFLSLWHVSFFWWGSKVGRGHVEFLTHYSTCFPPFIISNPVLAPPSVINLILGPPLCSLTYIFYIF
jgi:hypothetical protein